MDLIITNKNDRFIYRVSALIYNKELTKILLFNVDGREWWLLPGGKVKMNEASVDAIKRELKEELNLTDINLNLMTISEEFVKDKGYNNHQLELIYKGVFNGKIDKNEIKGLDGNWAHYKWIDVNNIDAYKIHPNEIKKIITDNTIKHIIANEN